MDKVQNNVKEAMMQFTAIQSTILSLDQRLIELQTDMNYAIRILDKLRKLMGDIEYDIDDILDPDGEKLLESITSNIHSTDVRGTSGDYCEKKEEEFPGMEEQNSIYDRVMRIKAERKRQAELDQQHIATQEQTNSVDT
jgi:hypothetical protein